MDSFQKPTDLPYLWHDGGSCCVTKHAMDAQARILKDLLAQIASKETEEEGTENGFAGEFLVSY